MMGWQNLAACAEVDPELFFPESARASSGVKKFCAGCPVSDECLTVALSERIEFGVWGGLNSSQREQIRKGLSA